MDELNPSRNDIPLNFLSSLFCVAVNFGIKKQTKSCKKKWYLSNY